MTNPSTCCSQRLMPSALVAKIVVSSMKTPAAAINPLDDLEALHSPEAEALLADVRVV